MNEFILKLRNKIAVDSGNELKIGKNVRMRKSKIKIRGCNNQLIIHENCNLREVDIEIRGENSIIEIGKNTIIGEGTYFSAKEGCSIKVGEDCMFSRNIDIMTSDGHIITQNGIRVNLSKSIEIGNRVWVSDHVVILKGSKIGNNSVVGINSVITKEFEDSNVIIAGNPAKIVKKGIEWNKK